MLYSDFRGQVDPPVIVRRDALLVWLREQSAASGGTRRLTVLEIADECPVYAGGGGYNRARGDLVALQWFGLVGGSVGGVPADASTVWAVWPDPC